MNFLIRACLYTCTFMYNNTMKNVGRKDVFSAKNNNFDSLIFACRWLLYNLLPAFGREKTERFFVLISAG